MDSENRMYLTSDLMKYIHSGLENAEWKMKFIEENLSDFQYDVTDTEALTKVLELDIDWNTVSADDPELIKTISKKTGLTIPDVRQAVSIIDDAFNAKYDTDYPWLIWTFLDPCMGQRQFVAGADFRQDVPDVLSLPPFLMTNWIEKELICNPVMGAGGFAFCNMKSLHLPYTVRFLNVGDFLGCCRLQNFTVDPRNEFFSSDEQGLLYDRSGTTLKYIPNGRERIYINKNVEHIDEGLIDAFSESGAGMSDLSEYEGDWDKLLKFIEVDPENPWFKSDEDGVLYDWDGNELIVPPCTDRETAESEYRINSEAYRQELEDLESENSDRV